MPVVMVCCLLSAKWGSADCAVTKLTVFDSTSLLRWEAKPWRQGCLKMPWPGSTGAVPGPALVLNEGDWSPREDDVRAV